MILDTSVIVALLRGERDAAELSSAIESAESVAISAATLLEAHLVLGPAFDDVLASFAEAAQATVIPFDDAQLRIAIAAHRRFGRGSGSPARLNFGDCFSYALAASSGAPLLSIGNDFTHTDVPAASPGDRRGEGAQGTQPAPSRLRHHDLPS